MKRVPGRGGLNFTKYGLRKMQYWDSPPRTTTDIFGLYVKKSTYMGFCTLPFWNKKKNKQNDKILLSCIIIMHKVKYVHGRTVLYYYFPRPMSMLLYMIFSRSFQGPKVGTQFFCFVRKLQTCKQFFLLICLRAPPLPATTWPAEHKSLAINSIRFSRAETIWFSFENCTSLPFPYSHGIEKGFNFHIRVQWF